MYLSLRLVSGGVLEQAPAKRLRRWTTEQRGPGCLEGWEVELRELSKAAVEGLQGWIAHWLIRLGAFAGCHVQATLLR